MWRALYLRSFAQLAALKAPKRFALMPWHLASQITLNSFAKSKPASFALAIIQ
jgi:hypothetical protein